jgi:hypothetical protein
MRSSRDLAGPGTWTVGGRRRDLGRPVWVRLEHLFLASADITRAPPSPPRAPGPDLDAPAPPGSVLLEGDVPGVLMEWNRSARGLWVGLVSLELGYADGRHERMRLSPQLVPEYALRPRAAPAADPARRPRRRRSRRHP